MNPASAPPPIRPCSPSPVPLRRLFSPLPPRPLLLPSPFASSRIPFVSHPSGGPCKRGPTSCLPLLPTTNPARVTLPTAVTSVACRRGRKRRAGSHGMYRIYVRHSSMLYAICSMPARNLCIALESASKRSSFYERQIKDLEVSTPSFLPLRRHLSSLGIARLLHRAVSICLIHADVAALWRLPDVLKSAIITCTPPAASCGSHRA